MKTLLEILNPI